MKKSNKNGSYTKRRQNSKRRHNKFKNKHDYQRTKNAHLKLSQTHTLESFKHLSNNQLPKNHRLEDSFSFINKKPFLYKYGSALLIYNAIFIALVTVFIDIRYPEYKSALMLIAVFFCYPLYFGLLVKAYYSEKLFNFARDKATDKVTDKAANKSLAQGSYSHRANQLRINVHNETLTIKATDINQLIYFVSRRFVYLEIQLNSGRVLKFCLFRFASEFGELLQLRQLGQSFYQLCANSKQSSLTYTRPTYYDKYPTWLVHGVNLIFSGLLCYYLADVTNFTVTVMSLAILFSFVYVLLSLHIELTKAIEEDDKNQQKIISGVYINKR